MRKERNAAREGRQYRTEKKAIEAAPSAKGKKTHSRMALTFHRPCLSSLSLSLSPSKPKHPILLRRECCCEASDAHRDEAEAMSGKGGEDCVERRCEKIDTAWLRTKKRLLAAFAADLVRMNFCSPAAFPLFWYNTDEKTRAREKEREGESVQGSDGVGRKRREKKFALCQPTTPRHLPKFLQSPPTNNTFVPPPSSPPTFVPLASR